MEELIRVLTEERNLLEVLVHRLETLRHFLSLDRPRSVEWAAMEVDQASDLLRAAERRRDAASGRVADELGLRTGSPSLRELAGLDTPYATTLQGLRNEFLSLTAQVEELFAAVRANVARGQHLVHEALRPLSGNRGATLYGPDRHVQRGVVSRYEGVL